MLEFKSALKPFIFVVKDQNFFFFGGLVLRLSLVIADASSAQIRRKMSDSVLSFQVVSDHVSRQSCHT